MDACYKAALELYAETSAKNAKFKKVHDHYMKFLEDQVLWFRVAEGNFDNFMQARPQGRGGSEEADRRRRSSPLGERSASARRSLRAGAFSDFAGALHARIAGDFGVLRARSFAASGAARSSPCRGPRRSGLSRNIVTCFGNATTSATRIELQHHERDRAPVDVRALHFLGRDAAQVEEREAEGRVHERGLQVHAQHHAEPDQRGVLADDRA